MAKSRKQTTADQLADMMKGTGFDSIRYGWHLIGAGPARFGWAAFSTAGAGLFLGRTAHEALNPSADDYDY